MSSAFRSALADESRPVNASSDCLRSARVTTTRGLSPANPANAWDARVEVDAVGDGGPSVPGRYAAPERLRCGMRRAALDSRDIDAVDIARVDARERECVDSDAPSDSGSSTGDSANQDSDRGAKSRPVGVN